MGVQTAKIEASKRTRLIKLIHIGIDELRMADETYRNVISEISNGKYRSSTHLTDFQLEQVLEHLKKCGFRIRSKKGDRAQAKSEQMSKIRALWLQLFEAGIVKNPAEAAIAAFIKRHTGIDDPHWISEAQASRVIEILKKWIKRSANNQAGGAVTEST